MSLADHLTLGQRNKLLEGVDSPVGFVVMVMHPPLSKWMANPDRWVQR